MPQPATITDAPAGQIVQLGAQLINFAVASSNGVGPLVAEEIEWSAGFSAYDATDDFNVVRKTAYSTQRGVGSMVVQIKGGANAIHPFDTGTFKNTDNQDVPFVVTKGGPKFSQGGATKLVIEIAERIPISPLPHGIGGDVFDTPFACGPLRWHKPIPRDNGHLVIRQQFCQYHSAWEQQPTGTVRDFGAPYYLVEETESQPTGVAGVITWDRAWATIPLDRVEQGTVVKTYKYIDKLYINNAFSGVAGITVQARTVLCDIKWKYSRNINNLVPISQPPDASIVTLSKDNVTVSVVRTTNGFPYNPNSPGTDSNEFYHIISTDIGNYMGDIYYRKEIFA